VAKLEISFGKVMDDLLALFCATNVSFCMQQMKGDNSITVTMYSTADFNSV